MSFHSETVTKKTRKAYVCEQCHTRIEVGSQCIRYSGYYEDFYYGHEHLDCNAASKAWPGRECLNWDEPIPFLHDLEREDWPWLLKDYPSVATRMNLAHRIVER